MSSQDIIYKMKNRDRGDYVRNDMFTQSDHIYDGIHTQR